MTTQPLAARMRPTTLDEIVGQDHLVFPGSPLKAIVEGSSNASVLLWGPPGSGKTTIASVIAASTAKDFVELSATSASVKEVRAVFEAARKRADEDGVATILFLDEIHRFTKAQQDILLPAVESGLISLVGATTENPSFSVNAALVSRSILLVLKPITNDDIIVLLQRALDEDPELSALPLKFDDGVLDAVADLSSGDVRQALNRLETLVDTAQASQVSRISMQLLEQVTDTALFTFYDIESLSNVFTLCAYTPRKDTADTLEVFYLVDDAEDGSNLIDQLDRNALGRALFASNPAMPPYPLTQIKFYDLRQPGANLRLAALVGLSSAERVGDPTSRSDYPSHLRPVCDTDQDYAPTRHPFLAGYNSMNYDTTMLALYLAEVFADYQERAARTRGMKQHARVARPGQTKADAQTNLKELNDQQPQLRTVSARTMREHSDSLFSEENIDYMPRALGWDSPAAAIRRAMLASGRHLDVSRLNELQFKVALKRLLGMLGRQIKESEKLGHDHRTAQRVHQALAQSSVPMSVGQLAADLRLPVPTIRRQLQRLGTTGQLDRLPPTDASPAVTYRLNQAHPGPVRTISQEVMPR